MKRPTDHEITEALISNCTVNNDRWHFIDTGGSHSEQEARMIVESCLILDARVTDRISSEGWHSMVVRLSQVEDMLEEIYAQEAT